MVEWLEYLGNGAEKCPKGHEIKPGFRRLMPGKLSL